MQYGVFSFALVFLALLLTNSHANPLENDDDGDDSNENDLEISFTVNRILEDPNDSSDESDEVDDDDDDEDYYYYEDLTPERKEQLEKEPYRRTGKWKSGWRTYPLFIIILGGFRWDYLESFQNLTAFAYLRKHGTSIPHVSTVFPTEDYPVWTSMATGQYPEDHGIVGDFMYDLKSQTLFNASDISSTKYAFWWQHTTPFWSTASKHGKKVAFYNWHDCQLPGAALENPADCKPYEPLPPRAAPSRSKIARQFDEAFTKLNKDGYDISLAYTDLIRRVSETHGPKSAQMNEALHTIDDVLQAKLTDIRSKEFTKGLRMNVLVLSDYGMTDLAETTDVSIEDYINLADVQYLIYSSGYATIVPFALNHAKIISDLSDMPGMDIYLSKPVQDPPIYGADIIPDSLKYGKGFYAQDILVVAKPSFHIKSDLEDSEKVIRVHDLDDDELKAGHGFNPNPVQIFHPYIDKRTIITKKLNDTIDGYYRYEKFKWDMHTQAFAMGPDFKKNYKMYDPIEIVDFYQMICFLLQIPPEDHHGSWERIAPMLEISSAPSVLSFNCITFVLFFIPILLF